MRLSYGNSYKSKTFLTFVNFYFDPKFPNLHTGDNESRAIIQPQSLNDPAVKELISILIDWINDELAEERIIVKDIEEDLYDGQVLHKLLEKLTDRKLDVPEVTQSEEGQRQKLQIVLNAVNHVCIILDMLHMNTTNLEVVTFEIWKKNSFFCSS